MIVNDRNDSKKEYYQSSQQAFYFFKDIEGAETGDIIEVYEKNILVGSRVWNGSYTDIPVMGYDYSDYTAGYCTNGSIPTFKLIKADGGEEYLLYGYIEPWESNGLFISEALKRNHQMPDKFSISNVYPNPFNPSTTISFEVPFSSKVKLEVYDLNGFKIDVLADEFFDSGYYSLDWTAQGYPSGIYFVKLVVDGYIDIQKIMLIK